jgi:hypothetical protein
VIDDVDVRMLVSEAGFAAINLRALAELATGEAAGCHTSTLLRMSARPGTCSEIQKVMPSKRPLQVGAERFPSCVIVTMAVCWVATHEWSAVEMG